MKARTVLCHVLRFLASSLALLQPGPQSSPQPPVTSVLSPLPWTPVLCPTDCTCSLSLSRSSFKVLRTVNCSSLGLDLPPMNISLDTEAVDLSGNPLFTGSLALLRDLVSLRELAIVGCHVHSLEDLTLAGHDWSLGARLLNADDNRLTHLHNRSFINLADLENLTLSNNRIESIHPGAFYGLHRLTSLDLTGNRLTTLTDARWLCQIQRMRSLVLSANALHSVPDMTFRCVADLRSLDLSANRIRQIGNEAFFGLYHLRHLSLADNGLGTVPSDALSRLPAILDLALSGNAFRELPTDSFRSAAEMTSLLLNRMSELQLVDRGSFRNLSSLERLEIRNSPRLKYIHYRAFESLPRLRILDLGSCALETLDAELVAGLPSLSWLRLSLNPLVCDCVLSWLAQRLSSNLTGSELVVSGPEETRCQFPAELKDVPIGRVPLEQLSGKCGPRILPLFSHEVQISMTDPTRIHCRAVGVPRPRSFWISHDVQGLRHRSINNTETGDEEGKEEGEEEEVLTVESTSIEDQGVYICQAVSRRGQDQRFVFLHVHPLNTSILILRLTTSSITVTWRGTDHTREYLLTYRKLTDNVTSANTVPIKHYMRSFTASELPPETDYEFCMCVRRTPTNHFRVVNCTVASTRNRKYGESGLHNLVPYVIVVGVFVIGAILCIVSTIVCSSKVFDRTKRSIQEVTSADHMSEMFLASLDNASNMASETYENEAVSAAIFDEADLDEIRSTAYMSSARSP